MQQITINTSNKNIPLELNYFPNKSSNRVLLLVGGSGDDKESLVPIVQKLLSSKLDYNYATISFRSRDLEEQRNDLEEIIDYLIQEKQAKNIAIACTSAGAYSSTMVIILPKYNNIITEVVFLDPADYYIGQKQEHTWSGVDIYNPKEKTVCLNLQDITSLVKVHVVRFTLRNYSRDGYDSVEKRGQDNPNLFPRLNEKMVKLFYEYVPEQNRGEYLEVTDLPHAFMRDGDVSKNIEKIAEIIISLL